MTVLDLIKEKQNKKSISRFYNKIWLCIKESGVKQ